MHFYLSSGKCLFGVPLGSDVPYPRGAAHRTRGVRYRKRVSSLNFYFSELTLSIGVFMILWCQADATFECHVAKVDDGVAHAAKGCVDAAIGLFCNFFEGKFVIHTHHEHLLLEPSRQPQKSFLRIFSYINNYISSTKKQRPYSFTSTFPSSVMPSTLI